MNCDKDRSVTIDSVALQPTQAVCASVRRDTKGRIVVLPRRLLV